MANLNTVAPDDDDGERTAERHSIDFQAENQQHRSARKPPNNRQRDPDPNPNTRVRSRSKPKSHRSPNNRPQKTVTAAAFGGALISGGGEAKLTEACLSEVANGKASSVETSMTAKGPDENTVLATVSTACIHWRDS